MDIREFFNKQRWIFAKTYAEKAPHEYCLKDKVVGTKQDFVDAVKYIQQNGFIAKFWNRPNTYIYLDGHLYWVMWDVAEEAILINRSDVSNYDLMIYLKKKQGDN